MKEELVIFLNNLKPEFDSIKLQATKYVDAESNIRDDGAAKIYRRQWVAPQNFGLLLFPPAEEILFKKFHEETNLIIPKLYQDILSQMNGCFVYDFELFGLLETNLLDRTILQQHNLKVANVSWITSYNIDENLFHIGGRLYSEIENIGYFIEENKILAIRENGEILNVWTNFSDFLNHEINIAEQIMLDEKNNNR